MVINIKPQYVVRKIYCDPFSHVMDRCLYTQQLQQRRTSFNTRSMHNSLKYDAIGYVRSYRNSLVFIIFWYSFDNRFILSFLGNHYPLTFQFWLFINGNQHQTPICRLQNLL